MTVKLQTEHHLEFLSLKKGCTGSSESTHVKIPHCWKSHITAHLLSLQPPVKARTGLIIHIILPEPSLLTYTEYGSRIRWKFRQNLNKSAWVFKV